MASTVGSSWKQPLRSEGHGLERQRSIGTAEQPATGSGWLVREAVPDPRSSIRTAALSGEEKNVGNAAGQGVQERRKTGGKEDHSCSPGGRSTGSAFESRF